VEVRISATLCAFRSMFYTLLPPSVVPLSTSLSREGHVLVLDGAVGVRASSIASPVTPIARPDLETHSAMRRRLVFVAVVGEWVGCLLRELG
jgi:hypothetical protein